MNRQRDRTTGGPRRRALRAGAAWACAAGFAAPGVAQCVPEWSSLGTNITGAVYGMSPGWGNPASPAAACLVVGGGSTSPGTVLLKKVALWDGWIWRYPTSGLSAAPDDVESPSPPPGMSSPLSFYVGGNLQLAGSVPVEDIALWSFGAWSEPGGGLGGSVAALFWCPGPAPLGPALYAGGQITSAGGQPIRGLARWDGAQWTSVGGGLSNWPITSNPRANAFALYDDDGPGPRPTALYVGGPFDYAGGVLVNSIARWDGTTWEPVGWGISGSDVRTMAVFDHDGPGPERESLFVGGSAIHTGGLQTNGLGRWDGAAWHAVPGWNGSAPRDLAVFDDDGPGPNKPALFVAGLSITASGVFTNGKIVKWDGQRWDGVGGGVTGAPFGIPEVFAIDVFDEDGPGPNPGGLYVGGWFNTAGGVPAPRIARWGCPLPPRCDANCNRDFHPVTGAPLLSVFDFSCFQTRYVLQDPYADCNEDEQLTVQDFGCFQTKFVAGCP